jgi:opacity protein-like surface antigen
MKTKQVVIMCLMLAAAQQAYSQAQVALGIKAGPNFSTIDTKASAGTNYRNRAGFHGGAFLLIKAAKFGIQPEIVFSQQGSKVQIDSKDLESNFSYMNIPIILKLYTVAGINIQAGPQFGFVMNGEAPVQQTVGGVTNVEDVKDRMKASDFTLALGLGWDLPFGLTLDARYNLGLSKIYDDAPPQQTGDAKNQVFQFSLGYKLINFGK